MKQLLLIGSGHAHAQVLKDWISAPVPGVALTLVSPAALAPYSGMVPGWLAGAYRYEDICIDMAALCAAAGGRFVLGEVAALEADTRRVTLTDGTVLDADVLSLNIGSTLQPPELDNAQVLSLRPLGALRLAWEALLPRLAQHPAGQPLRVTAVGGGAAGAEALLAVLARLRREQPGLALRPTLITRGPTLLAGMARGAAAALRRELAAAGVELRCNTPFDDTIGRSCDLLLWATGAQAHAWPQRAGLAVDGGGFVRVDTQLRSPSHPAVLAVGDCAAWAQPLPKAGVFAVRMGPVLSHNLRAAFTGAPLQDFLPQRDHLVLLATGYGDDSHGGGRALAARGALSAHGRWLGGPLWRWKDRIDRGFIQRFTLPPRQD